MWARIFQPNTCKCNRCMYFKLYYYRNQEKLLLWLFFSSSSTETNNLSAGILLTVLWNKMKKKIKFGQKHICTETLKLLRNVLETFHIRNVWSLCNNSVDKYYFVDQSVLAEKNTDRNQTDTDSIFPIIQENLLFISD